MIKIKILNPFKGRNEPTFRPINIADQYLLWSDYSIQFTNSNDYDFLFIGMDDFINKKVPLQQSIDEGLEFLSNITGDYFLFDGSDSTSLMGAYEVFKESNAIFLFKNQLLKNREDYKTPTAFNKWFFGNNSDLDLGYDIPEDVWSRIKLSGYNLGNLLPDYHNHFSICENKTIDVCAIYQAYHKENYDHGARNDIMYTNHRTGAWNTLDSISSKYNIHRDKLLKEEYLGVLYNSKIALSPYGMGEVCFRDFELMQYGTLMLKPDMSRIKTYPNPYIENETYIPVKADWSDLNEKVEEILGNYNNFHYIIENFRNTFKSLYTVDGVCMYWYDIFCKSDSVTSSV